MSRPWGLELASETEYNPALWRASGRLTLAERPLNGLSRHQNFDRTTREHRTTGATAIACKHDKIDWSDNPMAVPRKKVTGMKRGQRRAHDALKAPSYVEDKESGELRRPHHIDLKSGKYRGRQILEPKSDI